MDLLAVTDFPDIRYKSAVQSAHGNLLVIPREGGYLVRLYVEMDKLGEEERVANRGITVDKLIAVAQRILHPYKLEVKEVPWWSVYEIGQRICDKYDDVPAQDAASRPPRVFIAGDACHTHSPKAGQGMNFSMQDTFNLGWKLAAVLRKQCAPELLHSYSAERQVVAQELIDFDREWAKMFSDRPRQGAVGESEGVDPKEFQKYFERHGRFTAGMGTHYRPSVITGEAAHQHLAAGFVIGTRFHSAPVVRITDARPLQLGHVGKADGRWRLYAFAGANDHRDASAGIGGLCRFLEESARSPVRRYTRPGQDIDAVFDVRAIFQQRHDELAIASLPALLLPRKGRYGLRDYEKVFAPDLKSGPDVFDLRGIDRAQGALVVVRPDQYIAHVLPLGAHEALAAFFAGFMLPV
jgi:phenol 2-monooxygenase/3-hydroxybenzoate 4-monooxygenase